MSTVLELTAVAKTFTMHLQGGIRLPVVTGVAFAVRAGQCVVLAGRSGAGKSSILKMIFGTYRCDAGSIRVHADGRTVDVAQAEPRQILVNIARGFISDLPLLLLDEPTASLDAGNRAVVVDLVAEKKRRGTAVVAIVHDDDVRAAIADTVIDVNRFTAAA